MQVLACACMCLYVLTCVSVCRDGSGPPPADLHTIFGQLFTALRRTPYTYFSNAPAHAQLWQVSLQGEGSIDVGGAYRESLSLAMGDLMAGAAGLFIECPNATNGVGLYVCATP
jgi:hypothetical protein